jgi:hypothetical protein
MHLYVLDPRHGIAPHFSTTNQAGCNLQIHDSFANNRARRIDFDDAQPFLLDLFVMGKSFESEFLFEVAVVKGLPLRHLLPCCRD